MRKAIFIFIISVLLLHAKCVAQNNTVYGAGISYTNGIPTFVPPSRSARVAIDTVTGKWYEFATPGGWRFAGDRIQRVSGCSAPSYTPTKAQSWMVINNCTEAQNGQGPELYAYDGSAWIFINEKSTGGGVYTGGEGIVIDSPQIRIDTLDRLSFATSPTLPGGVGTIRWNNTDGTLEFGMKGGNVTQQIGQELPVLVKHADNSGLANGAVVYVVGSDGTNKTVRLAKADAESTSANTFGVMSESATGGNKAFCTTFGLVRDINTASLTEGQMVWVSPATAGAMTTTRPTAPNHAVQVGFCIRSHATQGIIFVSVQNGYELGELHDVSITSPATGQVLKYDTDKWVNGTAPASTLNDLTDVTITSPANTQVLQYNSATTQWVNATLAAITGTGSANKLAIWSGASGITFNTYAGLITQTANGITQQLGSYSYFGQVDQYSVPYFGQGAYAKDGSGAVTPVSTGFSSGIVSILEPQAQGLSFFSAPSGTATTTNIFTNNYLRFRVTKTGQIAAGVATPDAAAKIDITSTTQGVLFPRMTGTQRDAIAAPPDGLVVYNTTASKLQVRAAGAWVDLH